MSVTERKKEYLDLSRTYTLTPSMSSVADQLPADKLELSNSSKDFQSNSSTNELFRPPGIIPVSGFDKQTEMIKSPSGSTVDDFEG